MQGELVVMEVRWEEEEVMLERGSMAARMAASTEVVAVMVALAVISRWWWVRHAICLRNEAQGRENCLFDACIHISCSETTCDVGDQLQALCTRLHAPRWFSDCSDSLGLTELYASVGLLDGALVSRISII